MSNSPTFTNFIDQKTAYLERDAWLDSGGRIDKFFLFYDWFCPNDELLSRANALFPQAMKAMFMLGVDASKTYVFFKNNCRGMADGTYDDLRICDGITGDVVWTIVPQNDSGQCEIWGRLNNWDGALVETDRGLTVALEMARKQKEEMEMHKNTQTENA